MMCYSQKFVCCTFQRQTAFTPFKNFLLCPIFPFDLSATILFHFNFDVENCSAFLLPAIHQGQVKSSDQRQRQNNVSSFLGVANDVDNFLSFLVVLLLIQQAKPRHHFCTVAAEDQADTKSHLYGPATAPRSIQISTLGIHRGGLADRIGWVL